MPAVSLSGVYNFQAFTDAGALAASFRLYTYAPNTTTKKTAYTEATGAVAHTYASDGAGGEYIAVNARGELAAPLFLASGGYDLCLKTAAGVTIWTRRAYGTGDGVTDALTSLAASGGSALVGYTLGATDAVTRTLQAKMRSLTVSLDDFTGADPTGATASDAALQSALTWAFSQFPGTWRAVTLRIPRGHWLFEDNNPFGQIDFTTLSGGGDARYYLTIEGEGIGGTYIQWKPTGSGEAWLYDNGTAASSENRLAYFEFRDLQVFMDISALSTGGTVNGFRLFGDTDGANGVTQSLRLNGCRFVCLEAYNSPVAADIAKAGMLIKCLGDGSTMANADATKVTRCSVRGLKTLFHVANNDESVSHVFVDTDAEVMFGNVFEIKSGGSVNVFGGSYTMWTEGTQSYLVDYTLGDRQIAGTNNFYGLRLECNKDVANTGNYSGIINIDATAIATAYVSDIATTNFVGCNFYPISRTAGNTINLDSATRMVVNFIGCDGLDLSAHGLRWFSSIATRALTANTGTICNFRDGTAVSAADIVYDDADSIGRTSARGCRNTLDYDAIVSSGTSCRRRGNTSFGSNMSPKTVFLARADGKWPDANDTTEASVTLPKGAMIVAYGFRKAAGGNSSGGNNYSLAFMDGAGNQLPSSATSAANENTEHKIVVTNQMIIADDDLGYSSGVSCSQTVYLSCVAPNTGANNSNPAMAEGDSIWITYI